MKGSATDLFYMIIFITIVPLFMAITYYVADQMPAILDQSNAMTNVKTALGYWDSILFIAFILLGVISVALASRISAHPVFLFFAFMIYSFAILFSAQMSNLYTTVEGVTTFSTAFAQFPSVSLVQSNLPKIIAGFAVLLAIATYSKGGTRIGV